MIITSISSPEFNSVKKMSPQLDLAFEKALELLEQNVPDGKYQIDGDNIYASISSYTTRPTEEAKMEAHRDYIDVQLLLSGKESIIFESVDKLTPVTEYRPDVIFYSIGDEGDTVNLCAGEFAIIYPGEGHAPSLAVNGVSENVRKMVIKILA